ncbi:hypothetical protein [Pelagibacterium xiamenense]|uniref:hypothetical protein n=1 Tax=Pelagibacterium xiamenense TaxID=2901140 RepID=UPI001E38A632|nr:hypothetical protein [Pelagibacterium xiamenense]MCD7059469.1 hypothetical protein [Pelagibacterium xiamenense]
MSTKRLILERGLDLSFWFNGILIPARSGESVLARFTQPLVALNEDETYVISLVASGVAIKYRGRYFIVCSRHQLKGWRSEQIALLTSDGEFCITSGGVRHFVDGLYENGVHDLAAFDFTDPCLEIPALQERFYNFVEIPPDVRSDNIIAMIASGFPTGDQQLSLEGSTRAFKQARRVLTCLPDGPEQPNDETLLRLRVLQPLVSHPDGMSGGATFVIQVANGEARAYFAGIVLMGSKEILHIARAGYVRQFLDFALNDR